MDLNDLPKSKISSFQELWVWSYGKLAQTCSDLLFMCKSNNDFPTTSPNPKFQVFVTYDWIKKSFNVMEIHKDKGVVAYLTHFPLFDLSLIIQTSILSKFQVFATSGSRYTCRYITIFWPLGTTPAIITSHCTLLL